MVNDDMALVRDYAASHSEPAFATLVGRHIALVHSVALRQVGDAHLAQGVTQAVFIILAQKAASLGPDTILCAWLYRTACYVAAETRRTRRRREQREQEAYMQSIMNAARGNSSHPCWTRRWLASAGPTVPRWCCASLKTEPRRKSPQR
jgi:DNA-directed RNA polymerase specialized sigma24 family protein